MTELFLKDQSSSHLASELKRKCLDYVREHLEEDFLESEFGEKLTKGAQEDETGEQLLINGQDWIRQMDIYILYGKIENGRKVLDEIIANAKLDSEEKSILEDWRDHAFLSIFEVKKITADKINAMDALAEADYEIYFNDPDKGQEFIRSVPIGSFIQTSILSVKGIWFLSGLQSIIPKGHDDAIFHTYIIKASAHQSFRNNPEKLQRALKIQRKYYEVFTDMFGTNELILSPDKAQEKLQEYYDKLVDSFGNKNKAIAIELHPDFQEAETIGIVMDEHEGQHEFMDYGKFIEIFKTGNISKKAGDFVMDYLEDESLPAFVFRRVKKKYPRNFFKVMLETTARADRRIYSVDNFDKLMDIFKPGWKEVYPAVIPLNQRFEKYYYNLGRNEPCYCNSGKKFKKCHGK